MFKKNRVLYFVILLVVIGITGCLEQAQNSVESEQDTYEQDSEFKNWAIDTMYIIAVDIEGLVNAGNTLDLVSVELYSGKLSHDANKALNEIDQFEVSPVFKSSKDELKLALQDFEQAGHYAKTGVSNSNSDDISTYSDYMESASEHLKKSRNLLSLSTDGTTDSIEQTLPPSTTRESTSLEKPKNITNSIGMEFVLIPAGEFDMGSPPNEIGRSSNEGPVHRVTISNAFYMGKYEVTQKQWQDIMGSNPSYVKGDDLPVAWVSWNDVQNFVWMLNNVEGTDKYRLPSEAEWEYAVRAGTKTRYFFDDESKFDEYAWRNSNSSHHNVGMKKPNPWGLYDMYGNVAEFVQDSMNNHNYDGAPIDGSAWESRDKSLARVVRGSFSNRNWEMYRSAYRNGARPYDRVQFYGFRLVKET